MLTSLNPGPAPNAHTFHVASQILLLERDSFRRRCLLLLRKSSQGLLFRCLLSAAQPIGYLDNTRESYLLNKAPQPIVMLPLISQFNFERMRGHTQFRRVVPETLDAHLVPVDNTHPYCIVRWELYSNRVSQILNTLCDGVPVMISQIKLPSIPRRCVQKPRYFQEYQRSGTKIVGRETTTLVDCQNEHASDIQVRRTRPPTTVNTLTIPSCNERMAVSEGRNDIDLRILSRKPDKVLLNKLTNTSTTAAVYAVPKYQLLQLPGTTTCHGNALPGAGIKKLSALQIHTFTRGKYTDAAPHQEPLAGHRAAYQKVNTADEVKTHPVFWPFFIVTFAIIMVPKLG